MALIVQKFGGSSVADRDRIFNVARIVANTHALRATTWWWWCPPRAIPPTT